MPTLSLPVALAVALAAFGACASDPPAAVSPPTALDPAVAAAAAADMAAGAGVALAGAAGSPAAADSLGQLDAATAAAYARITSEARAQGVAGRSYGEIVQWVGTQLRGRPYVGGMLDVPARETLVADLTRFDCVLLVENVLAVAHAIATDDTTPEAYLAELRRMRYRGGAMDGYASRLHYFSEWLADNDARGTVRNVTADAGGVPFEKRIDFMSTHRASYPHLADDAAFAAVRQHEAALAGRAMVYIPKASIAAAYAAMQPGDVVAMTTSIGGLDVTHTGFVHVTGEGRSRRVGFLNASSVSNEVKVSPDLSAYVRDIRNQTGVVIARPVDPRADRASGE